ncbi:MAG TPA: ribonuclease HII [Dehalococcoidales bacterium]|nr:ribonuclease HII [Dehalococcoidales bacterium]
MPKQVDDRYVPVTAEESACRAQGYSQVAGVDEVGRGCLAGPVVASAVIMPSQLSHSWHSEVRDSKLLTPRQREILSQRIHDSAISIGTGVVEPYLIDRIGMTSAVHLAMKLALQQLKPLPDFVLVDYLTIQGLNLPQKGVREGDSRVFSIACASIVAKVFRDNLMRDLDGRYPGYGLARHKGYGTAGHLECLRKKGPSPVHRRLFLPVRNIAQISLEEHFKSLGGQ